MEISYHCVGGRVREDFMRRLATTLCLASLPFLQVSAAFASDIV